MFARLLSRLLSGWQRPQARLELVLYTKRDCPLCDAMKAELARARVRPPFQLVEVDVERDAELLARHGRSIPVLEIAGRAAFKGRLTAAEFERRYARRAAELAAEARAPRVAGGGERG